MEYTSQGRLIIVDDSDSPVTRVRIKKGELHIRLSEGATADTRLADDIFDRVFLVEAIIPADSNTVNIKINDDDNPNFLQLERGNMKEKTIVQRGVDFGVV